MEDLNDMLYFAEVVDRGGFAAAARAPGLPKSRLSRRVAELENRLGVRLLHRTTRKLSLTEAGERCHRHCLGMREQAEAAMEAVALVQGEPRGTLRVACPVTLAQTTLGPALPHFLARYRLVRVDIRVSNRVVDLVEEGVDVALRVRPTLEDSGSLVLKNLGLTQSLLVASPAQLARQGRPTDVVDLGRLNTGSMSPPKLSCWGRPHAILPQAFERRVAGQECVPVCHEAANAAAELRHAEALINLADQRVGVPQAGFPSSRVA